MATVMHTWRRAATAVWRRIAWQFCSAREVATTCLGVSAPLMIFLAIVLIAALGFERWAQHAHAQLRAAPLATSDKMNPTTKGAGMGWTDWSNLDAQRVAQFDAQLVPLSATPAVMDSILEAAASSEVRVESATYPQASDMGAGFGSYRFSLKASGESIALQRWLGNILTRHPALGIAALQLQRTSPEQSAASAQFDGVIFVRAEGAKAPASGAAAASSSGRPMP